MLRLVTPPPFRAVLLGKKSATFINNAKSHTTSVMQNNHTKSFEELHAYMFNEANKTKTESHPKQRTDQTTGSFRTDLRIKQEHYLLEKILARGFFIWLTRGGSFSAPSLGHRGCGSGGMLQIATSQISYCSFGRSLFFFFNRLRLL